MEKVGGKKYSVIFKNALPTLLKHQYIQLVKMVGTKAAVQDKGATVWAMDGNREVVDIEKGNLWYE